MFICAGFSCTGETRPGKACTGKAVLGQKASEAGNLGRYLAGPSTAPMLCECAQTGAFLAVTGAVCGDCCGVVLAYNFLLESKIYILILWAFPAWELCDTGICFSQ